MAREYAQSNLATDDENQSDLSLNSSPTPLKKSTARTASQRKALSSPTYGKSPSRDMNQKLSSNCPSVDTPLKSRYQPTVSSPASCINTPSRSKGQTTKTSSGPVADAQAPTRVTNHRTLPLSTSPSVLSPSNTIKQVKDVESKSFHTNIPSQSSRIVDAVSVLYTKVATASRPVSRSTDYTNENKTKRLVSHVTKRQDTQDLHLQLSPSQTSTPVRTQKSDTRLCIRAQDGRSLLGSMTGSEVCRSPSLLAKPLAVSPIVTHTSKKVQMTPISSTVCCSAIKPVSPRSNRSLNTQDLHLELSQSQTSQMCSPTLETPNDRIFGNGNDSGGSVRNSQFMNLQLSLSCDSEQTCDNSFVKINGMTNSISLSKESNKKILTKENCTLKKQYCGIAQAKIV